MRLILTIASLCLILWAVCVLAGCADLSGSDRMAADSAQAAKLAQTHALTLTQAERLLEAQDAEIQADNQARHAQHVIVLP